MISPVETIIRRATRKDHEKLNILSFATHEPYQVNMSKTGHNFYLWDDNGIKPWNNECGKLPDNHQLLNKELKDQQLPEWISPDLIISQNKAGQFQIARKLSDILRIPLIHIEHTLPPPNISVGRLKSIKLMKADINLFISDYSREKWGWSKEEAGVIHHGIDTNFFTPIPNIPRQKHILVICNDYINRDWCCGFNKFAQLTGWPNQKLIDFKAYGKTPGFSEYAPSREAINVAFNECGVFVNTATESPVPTVLLEAMSAGTPCVSTKNPMVCNIIRNGENGFLTDDPNEMRNLCKTLFENKNLAEQIGKNARQTILNKFPLNTFIANWNNYFYAALHIKK